MADRGNSGVCCGSGVYLLQYPYSLPNLLDSIPCHSPFPFRNILELVKVVFFLL